MTEEEFEAVMADFKSNHMCSIHMISGHHCKGVTAVIFYDGKFMRTRKGSIKTICDSKAILMRGPSFQSEMALYRTIPLKDMTHDMLTIVEVLES